MGVLFESSWWARFHGSVKTFAYWVWHSSYIGELWCFIASICKVQESGNFETNNTVAFTLVMSHPRWPCYHPCTTTHFCRLVHSSSTNKEDCPWSGRLLWRIFLPLGQNPFSPQVRWSIWCRAWLSGMTLQLSSLNLLQLKILRKLTAANLHLTTLLFPGPSELSLGLKISLTC